MRLLIDMDGVLVDLHGPWMSWINQEYGTNYTVQDINQWEISKLPGLCPKVYNYLRLPGTFSEAPAITWSRYYLQKLYSEGHEIIICTAAICGFEEKLQWIKKHIPFIKPEDVVFTYKKYLVQGDVLLDDKTQNLEEFATHGSGIGIAFTAAHNQDWTGPRVASWEQFYNTINAMVGEGEGELVSI